MRRLSAFVLGAAAGGGFPQWNCGCEVCRLAWAGDPRVKPRTQASLAVTADGLGDPDAAYVLPDKVIGLKRDDLTGFPYLCPDFVVELFSISDSTSKAQQKMERWIENGASLGWLIDPYEKKVYVYEAGAETAAVTGNTLSGRGPVEGFTLDLDELWRCYEI